MLRTKKARDLSIGEVFFIEHREYVHPNRTMIWYEQCEAHVLKGNYMGYLSHPDGYFASSVLLSDNVYMPCKEIDYCNRIHQAWLAINEYMDEIKTGVSFGDYMTQAFMEILELDDDRVHDIETACLLLKRASKLVRRNDDED